MARPLAPHLVHHITQRRCKYWSNTSRCAPWHHTWCITLAYGLHVLRIGHKLGFKQGATLALQSSFNRCHTFHRGGYTRKYIFTPQLEPYLALDLDLGAIMGILQGTPYDHSWRHTRRSVSHLEPYLALSLALGAILGTKSRTWSHTWHKARTWIHTWQHDGHLKL
jgi:hypothetical protein